MSASLRSVRAFAPVLDCHATVRLILDVDVDDADLLRASAEQQRTAFARSFSGDPYLYIHWALKSVNVTHVGLFGSLGFCTSLHLH